MIYRFLLPVLVASSLIPFAAAEENWSQFRGPNAQGSLPQAHPPTVFGLDQSVAWKTAISSGIGSPVVWGERIFLTGLEGGTLHMICLSRSNGKLIWKKEVPASQLETVHQKSNPASATPATDGQRVVGWFPSFGLMAWDMEGKEVWRKPMEMPFVVNGSGTSPVIAGSKVILNCDQQNGKSFLLAADVASGKTLWQTPRPLSVSGYTTPVIWARETGTEVIVSGSLNVTGYGLNDGLEHWSAGGTEAVSVCPTPVLGRDRLYIMSRSFGESPPPSGLEGLLTVADLDKSGGLSRQETPFFQKDGIYDFIDANRDSSITAEELKATGAHMKHGQFGIFCLRDPGSATGDLTASHVVWKHQKGIAKVATPILAGDRLYAVADGGLVTCTEAATGKVIFERERLGNEAGGDYFASPVEAEGRIYLCSSRGVVTVIEAADTLKILHQTKLGASVLATPALSGSYLLIRTETELIAFGK